METPLVFGSSGVTGLGPFRGYSFQLAMPMGVGLIDWSPGQQADDPNEPVDAPTSDALLASMAAVISAGHAPRGALMGVAELQALGVAMDQLRGGPQPHCLKTGCPLGCLPNRSQRIGLTLESSSRPVLEISHSSSFPLILVILVQQRKHASVVDDKFTSQTRICWANHPYHGSHLR